MSLLLPSGELLKKIQAELNIEEGREQDDLGKLKEWLAKQPHLPQILDDRLLAAFLFGCKNSLQRCKELLDLHFTVRGAAPEFFADRDPRGDVISTCLQTAFILPLPSLTSDGARVTVHGLVQPVSPNFNVVHAMKLVFLVADVRMRQDVCSGDVLVYDLAGSTLGHLAQLTLPLVRKFMVCGQSGYPVRVREVHFINTPSFLDKILALFKPLMKDKLADRIHVHADVGSLHEFVSPDVLPSQYGGTAGDLAALNEAWLARLHEARDWLVTHVASDEAKRPGGSPISHDDLFGMDGSFRQLSVD